MYSQMPGVRPGEGGGLKFWIDRLIIIIIIFIIICNIILFF